MREFWYDKRESRLKGKKIEFDVNSQITEFGASPRASCNLGKKALENTQMKCTVIANNCRQISS